MNKNMLVLFAVLAFIIVAGCLSGLRSFEPGIISDSSNSKLSKYPANADYALSSQESGTNQYALDRKIISTAQLQLEVDNIQTTFNKITNISIIQSGFVSSSSIYGFGERKNGQVTIRVPQKNFHSILEQIESLGNVKSKQIQGQDITEEFLDLDARLGNLKKQENRLLEILKMANTVKDVLEVEHELERVRGEIERLTGRLNYLNQSVEMSTITINAAEPALFTGESWGMADALREAVRGFIESIKGLIIFTGFILPILIYIILAVLIVLGIKKKVLPRLKALR